MDAAHEEISFGDTTVLLRILDSPRKKVANYADLDVKYNEFEANFFIFYKQPVYEQQGHEFAVG